MAQDNAFTDDQKQYLEGFIAGIAKKRGISVHNGSAVAAPALAGVDPGAVHLAAQDRAIAAGGMLVPEELAKREKNPFDMWDEIAANAAAGRLPKGLDVFRHKFHGLFYVAPNQDSFMLRLRLPGGILLSHQARGLADIAERCGGGTLDITTRANLQIREIGAAYPIAVLEAVQELGRQHPQPDRQPDSRHRPARADRHPAPHSRALSPHPQPPRVLRPAAQV
jgi:ferredoxin-nitrite reductase